MRSWLAILPLLLCLVTLLPATLACDDLINPNKQKEIGVVEAVKERYNTASGVKAILGEPKFPGLRKVGSINMEVLDDSDPKKLEEMVMLVTSWYAEQSSKMGTGIKKLYVYAIKDGQPYKVGIYEAASLSGQDFLYQDPSPENLPSPGE